jgi:hypothetical protein
VILAAIDCRAVIPPSYHKPIHGVATLRPDATAGALGDALDGQTANLDRANGRTADVIEIVEACYARADRVAAELMKPKRPSWMFWESKK